MYKCRKKSELQGFDRLLRAMLPCAGLVALLGTSACTTGGDPFRAVGADSTPQAEVALPVAVDPQVTATTAVVDAPDPAADASQTVSAKSQKEAAKLQEGTSMNLVDSPKPSEGPASPEDIPPAPEMAKTREEAIQQIRAKAATTGNNKPHIFEERKAATQRMSKEEQARIAAQMKAMAAKNAQTLDENEVVSKSKDSKLLKLRAKTHYEQAVKKIEN